MIQDKIYTYFDGNDGLHVLFIFDQMQQIESELKDCTWKDGYDYIIFDGCWFSTKYKIEHDWKDKKIVLLFPNMIEPSGETTKCHFPLFGEMTANMVFHNESYQAFMQLRGIPKEFSSFISTHISELQLLKVDKILSEYYNPQKISIDVLQRGLISSYLGQERLLDWNDILIRTIIVFGVPSEKKKRESFSRYLSSKPDIMAALSASFESTFGCPFSIISSNKIKETAECFKYNAITQHIAAIESDDYKQYKRTSSIFLQTLNNFIQATYQHPLRKMFYEAISNLGNRIKESKLIQWYGPEAEFSLVTESLCNPMLLALTKKIKSEPELCNNRLRTTSFKLIQSSPLQIVINFLINVCQIYERLKAFGTYKLNSRKEFIYRYKNEFCLIDMAYRKAVLEYQKIPPTSSIYEQLSSLKNCVDDDYSNAVNEFNIEWMKCVKEEEGRLNDIDGILHQQDFYKKYIGSSNTKIAIIISDALRYEVAVQLFNELSENKHTATLDVALAMLPSETKYCKDSLLPHTNLRYHEASMLVDGKILTTLQDRDSQLKKYNSEGICLNFNDVKKNVMENREALRKPVVYIYHNTIDTISHDSPDELTQMCENAIEELKRFIATLHSSYNFTNVILTADHGFLYNDIVFDDTNKHKIQDYTLELKTRYYITNSSKSKDCIQGVSKFFLKDVSAMKDDNDLMVAVPNGSNRFMAPGGGYEFTHGGSSLQELIIPILCSYRKREETKEKVDFTLVEHDLNIVSSQLHFKIIQVQAVSSDRQERKISLGIYKDNDIVSNELILSLSSTETINLNSRTYNIELVLSKPITDPILELRIYDVDDRINALLKKPVNNKTLIEQDF